MFFFVLYPCTQGLSFPFLPASGLQPLLFWINSAKSLSRKERTVGEGRKGAVLSSMDIFKMN